MLKIKIEKSFKKDIEKAKKSRKIFKKGEIMSVLVEFAMKSKDVKSFDK